MKAKEFDEKFDEDSDEIMSELDLSSAIRVNQKQKRINNLIKDITRSPFEGVGKPEPLKHALSGYWSRRINDEQRMVYKIREESLYLAQLRYHY